MGLKKRGALQFQSVLIFDGIHISSSAYAKTNRTDEGSDREWVKRIWEIFRNYLREWRQPVVWLATAVVRRLWSEITYCAGCTSPRLLTRLSAFVIIVNIFMARW